MKMILRRAAQLLLDVNKAETELALKVYERLHLYRRLYETCGFTEETAAQLESHLLACAREGIKEEYAILSKFVWGEIDLKQVVIELKQWFIAHMNRSMNIGATVSS